MKFHNNDITMFVEHKERASYLFRWIKFSMQVKSTWYSHLKYGWNKKRNIKYNHAKIMFVEH